MDAARRGSKARHSSAPRFAEIEWLSPLPADDWADYRDRDGSMLEVLGLDAHRDERASFWPSRGPQWDALVRTAQGPVLVEAKAHIGEFLSPPTVAGPDSLSRLTAAFQRAQAGMQITPAADWTQCFYQSANRLAHLWYLRSLWLDAHLLLANFIGDADV